MSVISAYCNYLIVYRWYEVSHLRTSVSSILLGSQSPNKAVLHFINQINGSFLLGTYKQIVYFIIYDKYIYVHLKRDLITFYIHN